MPVEVQDRGQVQRLFPSCAPCVPDRVLRGSPVLSICLWERQPCRHFEGCGFLGGGGLRALNPKPLTLNPKP